MGTDEAKGLTRIRIRLDHETFLLLPQFITSVGHYIKASNDLLKVVTKTRHESCALKTVRLRRRAKATAQRTYKNK